VGVMSGKRLKFVIFVFERLDDLGSAARACGCRITVSSRIILELNLIVCPFVLIGQQVLIEDASNTATLSTSSEDVV
jgi:hypothetical protein